ncbi:MAG: glycosyltransferase [Vicinamibacteraceae bacterium]
MKILSVTHLLDAVSGGGTAERVVQLTRAWRARGVDGHILTNDVGLSPERRAELGSAGLSALPLLNRRYFVPARWRFVDELAREHDLVHIVGYWTAINLIAASAARRTGRLTVVTPGGALPLAGRSTLLKRLYNAGGGRRFIREAQAAIAIARHEYADLAGYGVPAERVHLIPNGVDEAWLAGGARPLPPADPGAPPTVLFIGRLAHSKGPDLLLEAFARIAGRFPAHRLILAGPDHGLRASLEHLAQARGVADRVAFPGYLGGDAKRAALRAADLLAIPSRHEAMSIVALDAGACGTPVLVTDGCGFEAVGEVDGGAVVPSTVDGLERGLVGLLGDREGLPARGARLRALVEARYRWSDVAERHLTLFEQVLEAAPASATPAGRR